MILTGYLHVVGTSWPPRDGDSRWFYWDHKNDTVSALSVMELAMYLTQMLGLSHARAAAMARVDG
jgi:hypothetical protein